MDVHHGDERFRALFEHVPVGLALCELDGGFSEVNGAFADLLAQTEIDPGASGLTDLLGAVPQDDPRARAWCDELTAVRTGTGTVARGELPLPGGAGGSRWVQITAARVVLGQRAFLLVHLDDTTSQRLERQRLVRLATHDELTGLANRTLLGERLDAALTRAGQSGLAVGLLYLDLDRFKQVNDSFGHAVGDGLLVAVAARLSGVLRAGDTAGRIGGDEFLVIACDVADAAGLREVSRRVTAALTRPLPVAGQQIAVRASVGAVLSRPGEPGECLIRRADAAMYAAKRAHHRQGPRPAPGRDTQLALLHEQAVVASAR